MSKIPLVLILKNYDFLTPLACGDVQVEGVDLRLDRASPMTRTIDDATIDGGELSFSHHLIRTDSGDRSFVAIPIFPTRAFRHRCFYVRRDSGFHDFAQLAGKRIGSNAWSDSGNTWSRSLLREKGVRLEEISWRVGPIDPGMPDRWQGSLPPYVQHVQGGRPLRDMLLDGELDALMCPQPPAGFYDVDSPIVRLLPDYRSAEHEYLLRTGIVPVQHITGIRREIFEKHPWVARSLFEAIEKSKRLWQACRRDLMDTSPWVLPDIEEAMRLIGPDWMPNGVRANRKAIAGLCAEELAQRLIANPIEPDSVFAEFEAVMSAI